MCHVLAGVLEAQCKNVARHTTVAIMHSPVEELLSANIPPAFRTLPPVLSDMDPAGAEDTVLIPAIVQGLAIGFGQAVQSIGEWQGFTVNEAQVVDTKASAVFGPLKPDITIHDAK